MRQGSKLFISKFIKRKQEADRSYSFFFTRSADFKFLSGQYIKIFLDHEDVDLRGTSRFFTISSGENDPFIRITTKIYTSSFKKALFNLKPKQEVNIFGPVGYFHFKNNKEPKIFIAGGIGITPFISVLNSVVKINSEILIINSFSYQKDILFKEEINKFLKINKNLKYVLTLTRENVEGYERGRINREMIKRNFQHVKKANIFIVGSVNFERDLYKEVLEMGVSERNIFKENFTDL